MSMESQFVKSRMPWHACNFAIVILPRDGGMSFKHRGWAISNKSLIMKGFYFFILPKYEEGGAGVREDVPAPLVPSALTAIVKHLR